MGNLIFKPASGGELILQEDGGTAALTIDTSGNTQVHGKLETASNAYSFANSGELNSLGYLNHNFLGASYYLSVTKSCDSGIFTEIDGTWSKMITSGASGSDDSDIFSKFSSGRWTPTVSGYYACLWSGGFPGIDTNEEIGGEIRRNGSTTAGYDTGYSQLVSPSSGFDLQTSGGGVLGLNTTDYLSLFMYHNEDVAANLNTGRTQIHIFYLGTSDL